MPTRPSRPKAAPVLTVTLNPAIDLELVVPAFTYTSLLRATEVRRSAGGKGLNVARVLAALGVNASAAALVAGLDGAVFTGLTAGAEFEYVNLAPAHFAPELGVRTNVTISAAGDPICKVNQPGVPLPATVWGKVRDRIGSLCRRRMWVVLAGALPPGLKTNAYGELIRLARKAGALVALDCTGEPLQRALAARPDLVKINAEELTATAQSSGAAGRGWRAIHADVQWLLKAGARNVIVTSGERTILAAGKMFGPEIIQLEPPHVAGKGSVGAGDAFLAGFLAAVLKDKSPVEALNLAAAAGAAKSALADLIFPTKREIEALLPKPE